MSESAKKIIKYFCDRFLEIDYYPKSISAILDLSINALQNFDEQTIDIFHKLNITKIRDFTNLTRDDILTLINEKKIDPIIVQNALIGANLIANAWNKRSEYVKKAKMKVVFTGLDFAGKTSLINRLLSDYNYSDTSKLEPTIGHIIEEYETERLNLIVWDLGGQKSNIEDYLAEPEKYFVQVDVLFFVIDAQDDLRYDLALKYLSDIIDILEFLNEMPYIMILLNKVDSDIANDPEFQIKLEYISEKITEIFIEKEKNWQFEITPTSLYNFYANEPEIAKSIKDFFSSKRLINKEEKNVPKEEIIELSNDIEDKLKQILDINLRLMDKVASELSEIRRILLRLTPSDISKSLYSIPFETLPSTFISRTNEFTQKAKQLIKSSNKKMKKKSKESKEKSKKGKQDTPIGPPKRLTLPKSEIQNVKLGKTKKLDDKIIIETKEKLHKTEEIDILSDNLSLKKMQESLNLKPPPPPPKIKSNNKIDRSTLRSQVISELKDIFIKRGIVSR